jgi:hypothetical protein
MRKITTAFYALKSWILMPEKGATDHAGAGPSGWP